METASVGSSVSTDSDDFVVVIPDCFDLDKPLPGFSVQNSLVASSIASHDSHVTSLSNQNQDEPPEYCEAVTSDGPLSPLGVVLEQPRSNDTPTTQQTPPTVRREFVPQPMTLKTVKDCRMYYNPLNVATGFMNTVSNLVEERLRIGPGKKQQQSESQQPAVGQLQEVESEDETFEVCVSVILNL